MRENEKELNIDVGIITIKPEEFSAVTSRLGNWNDLNKNHHHYICNSITDTYGLKYNIAAARCLEPGTGNAQSLATDMIEELNPKWLFLVGISGGFPEAEYSLGDVVLCTRLHDFSVCCDHEDEPSDFADSGGPMHSDVAKLLEVLPAYKDRLEAREWNLPTGLHKEKPTIDLHSSSLIEKLYGDEGWQQKVLSSLRNNFLEPRNPIYYFGPTASSDRLVKSTSVPKIWRGSARNLTNVEMELAGVYRVAQKKNIPVLAIRSLSDIIGYKRSPEWTQFACESAASFAICLIESGVLTLNVVSDNKDVTIHMDPSAKVQTTQENNFLSLPNSPFYSSGTIPLNVKSYIKRDADRELEGLLSDNALIWLHGEFCYGKSSLLVRVPEMLPEGWNVFHVKIDLYSPSEGTLEDIFLADLKDVYNDIKNWRSLNELLKEIKLALLIDEISGFNSFQDQGHFIEKIYGLVERAPFNHIRVVLTIPIPLDAYIKKVDLKNPKYYDRWKTVQLTEFNDNEMLKLFSLFPQSIMFSLQENLGTIKKYTAMKPDKVQKFCEDLWKYLKDKEIPIREIDQTVQNYIKELRNT